MSTTNIDWRAIVSVTAIVLTVLIIVSQLLPL